MRGFLNEIKNVAVNRATNRIKNLIADTIGGTNGLPMNSGSILPSSANRFGRVNPYEGEMVTYPEDLGSEDQGHMVLFNINEQENANVNFGGGRSIKKGPPGSSGEINNSPNSYYDQLKGQSTAHVKRAPTRRLSSSIAMYMPASVSVGTSAQYSEVEIGSLAVAAQHLLNQSDVPNPFDKPAEFGAAMLKKGEEAMGKARGTDAGVSFKEGLVRGILDPIPGLSGIGAVEDIGRGFVRNDRLELSFNGIGRRSFSFSFKCMPKSENEALAVDKIVNMFRFYMAPSFKGDVSLSRTMIVPATFDISYLFETGTPNFFLNRISTCVLESCNVTYGGERVQFYRPTTKLVNGKSMPGAPPVETSIELQFKEIELITRERIGVGY
tara:strand:- start:1988 stop:3133 length:1146 start_codon:yes stop_codon:yes gene_type:complete